MEKEVEEEILVYSRSKKRRSTDRFIKGPIPFKWLSAAAQLGTSTLEAGIMLWYKSGLCSSEVVRVGNSEVVSLSEKSEDSGRRALKKLSDAGLISIEHNNGQKQKVTIIK